jgi:non-homologous end joining protein Ku
MKREKSLILKKGCAGPSRFQSRIRTRLSSCSADLLKEIEKEFESEEKFSDHVQDSLADLVNGHFQKKQDLEHVKARFDTIHRPENCGKV